MNKLIILNNKSCKYVTEDESFLRVLRNYFSYKTLGVEYTAAYQNGGWDGRTHLISKKGAFFSGLFEKVSEFLKDHKVEFEVQDCRLPITLNTSYDVSEALTNLKMIPRDYQERIVDACISNRKGIVRAATGSGKTLAIALVTAKLNKPTIIYVIGLDLLKQFHDLFSKVFNEPIGYIGDGVCNIERINIASIWTIGSALNMKKKDICSDDDVDCNEKIDVSKKDQILDLLKRSKVHVLDECHICTCSTIETIHSKIDPEYIYGFSGTPYRDDNTDLLSNAILGEQIVDVSASELIKKGVLAQPIIKFVAVPHVVLPLAPYQTVYKTYITDNIVRNTMIINNTKELLEKKYTPLVLFKLINHGKILYDMMLEAGIKCQLLYGNDSLEKRGEVKQMLIDGKINVILASTIFDIGIDIPILSALVLAGGGKSSVRGIQRIGRILRQYPGKKTAVIIDFYDQVKFLKKHSKIRYDIYSTEPGFKIIKCKEMK